MTIERKPDGGPAYPLPIAVGPSGDVYHAAAWASGGMSLRDWFAGQALAGLVTARGFEPMKYAGIAYQIADAMLLERQRP